MKVGIYEELKFFGDTENEINCRNIANKMRLENAGIELIQKEKDYTKLTVMVRQYVKINEFLENLIRKDEKQNSYLIEDINLFMKHVKELGDLNDILKSQIGQIESFYGELKWRLSSN